MVAQYSIPRNLLEVYRTDEEHFEQYAAEGSEAVEENKEGFTLHQGEILETFSYYDNIIQIDDEYDYGDIANNGSVTLTGIDKNVFYKGVRLLHRKGWEKYDETIQLEELPEMLLGFIVEQSYSTNKVDLKLAGMTKLLEQKYQFDFSQMKISKILEEIIKTAGLEPVIDVTDLNDMVIDYSNASSSDSGDVDTSGISGSIASIAKKAIKGAKSDLEKCKRIHSWCAANIRYCPYECSRYSTPEECLAHKNALNCADTARLTCALMRAAGLKAVVVHGPYHFWTVITIGGKKYVSDQTSGSSGVGFDTYWLQGTGRISANGTGGKYYRECGNNPCC